MVKVEKKSINLVIVKTETYYKIMDAAWLRYKSDPAFKARCEVIGTLPGMVQLFAEDLLEAWAEDN